MARVKCFVFLLSYFPKYVYRAQVGCSSSLLMSCFIGMLFEYCLNHFDMVPLAPVITAITFVFLFYMHLFFFCKFLMYKHLYYYYYYYSFLLAYCFLYFLLTVMWPGFILKILFFHLFFFVFSVDFCFCGIFLCLFSLFVSDAYTYLVPSWMVLSKYLEKHLISQIFL